MSLRIESHKDFIFGAVSGIVLSAVVAVSVWNFLPHKPVPEKAATQPQPTEVEADSFSPVAPDAATCDDFIEAYSHGFSYVYAQYARQLYGQLDAQKVAQGKTPTGDIPITDLVIGSWIDACRANRQTSFSTTVLTTYQVNTAMQCAFGGCR